MSEGNGNGIDGLMLKSLEMFQAAIDQRDNLEIVCSEIVEGKEVLVVENSNINKEIEGHQITVDVSEIFAKGKDEKSIVAFVAVINNDRKSIVCEGVTRIVGYYSRVQNWNKSKIGELRDRLGANYALSGKAPVNEDARLALVDNA